MFRTTYCIVMTHPGAAGSVRHVLLNGGLGTMTQVQMVSGVWMASKMASIDGISLNL